MIERYKVIEGSQSAHCCFVASVVDMKQPVLIGGEHYDNQYEQICECFSMGEAQQIANALNQRAELLEALKKIAYGDVYNSTGLRWIAEEAITKSEAAE